jgi:omega-6 fatty acid desaturase (delta-12 desaturase)
MTDGAAPTAPNDWRAIIARYQRASRARSIAQIATTLVPLAALFYLMYRMLSWSYWITLVLAVPAAAFLVRTFIIMHDCAHGSFLPWKRINALVGWITGVLTMTAFGQWRHTHALHHASSGDLSRRGHGDVDTLTVREYLALPHLARLQYRLKRHPLVLFGLGPIHFVLTNRIPPRADAATSRQRVSVWSANIAIAAIYVSVSMWLGWSIVPLVYAPAMYLAAAAGIWLFYVQHQFEDTYWQGNETWDYATAAMRGSSYLKLPGVLRWFTGSIGLHHVHHLGPRIPNYELQRCHDENEVFHDVTIITLRQSVRTLRLTLWDEARGRLVGFREIGA